MEDHWQEGNAQMLKRPQIRIGIIITKDDQVLLMKRRSAVSGETAMHTGHEMSVIDWFCWDALPEPLFLPFEHLLTGRCYPALWDFSGGEKP